MYMCNRYLQLSSTQINTVVLSVGRSRSELFAFHGVCDSAAWVAAQRCDGSTAETCGPRKYA